MAIPATAMALTSAKGGGQDVASCSWQSQHSQRG